MNRGIKIGITGLPGAGKTHALLKVIEMLESNSAFQIDKYLMHLVLSASPSRTSIDSRIVRSYKGPPQRGP